jgi:hypothetical protein
VAYKTLWVRNQRVALEQLAKLTQAAMVDPLVRRTANQIVRDCASRDDMCELKAIFAAVKTGTQNVPGFERGVRYVSDPLDADYFTAPAQLIRECQAGACAEDCDSHAALICALAGTLGFVVGLRAYGEVKNDYEHVYAVALYPKVNGTRTLGLDTTVPDAKVGWEPPQANVLTAWIR